MRGRAEGYIEEGLADHWKDLGFCCESAGKMLESFEQRHSNKI